MAEKSSDYPVVLEKDGVKRTAHSPIARVQLETQGFKAEGAKKTRQSSQAKPASKTDEKPADKASDKNTDK